MRAQGSLAEQVDAGSMGSTAKLCADSTAWRTIQEAGEAGEACVSSLLNLDDCAGPEMTGSLRCKTHAEGNGGGADACLQFS